MSRIVWQQQRGYISGIQPGLLQFLCVPCYMVQVHRAECHLLCLRSRCFSRITAKNNNIQKRVSHQAVSSVNTADCLTGNEQVVDHLRKAISANLQTTVLIV